MSNPMLNEERWDALSRLDRGVPTTMTMDGAMNKTLILLGLLVLSLAGMWAAFWTGQLSTGFQAMMPWMIGGGIAGLVLVLINWFSPKSAPVTAPLYAIAKGIFLGGFTMLMEAQYPGLPTLAAVITIGITLGLVILYRTGIVRVSDGFVKGVIGATIGVFFALMALFLMNLFGIGGGIMQSLYGSGPIGIGFSLFMVGLATFNILADLKLIENGAKAGAPKWMEWAGAFALMVTIVWLYIEILRLLAKLRGRD